MFTPSQASRRRALRSRFDEELSSPDVGSSRINKEGSITISSPTFTLFLCPPEIPRFSTVPTNESLTAWSPRDSITLSSTRTLSAFENSAGSLHLALNQRFSSTDRLPCTISSWGTNPMIFL
ncbi:hypothetical protein ZOSMA_133G00160 [Zostera marina]|uniref:Uncharacterized protein n=1 Tax=Zostera marina TaxID=29655 RepID=A0A0K9Q0Z0_ZOSMR|nr:hypothetical protein ZOSMA_133G00160 [Zostera marina]